MESAAGRSASADVATAAEFTAEYRPGVAPDELVEHFDENGYVMIKEAGSHEPIERVRDVADRIVSEGGERGRWWGKPETAPRRVAGSRTNTIVPAVA